MKRGKNESWRSYCKRIGLEKRKILVQMEYDSKLNKISNKRKEYLKINNQKRKKE